MIGWNSKIKKKIYRQSINIKMSNTLPENTPEYNYLRVIVDNKLSFGSHIKMIRQNFCSRMQTFKRVKYLLGTKNALLLYKSKLLLYLDQGDLVYTSASEDQVCGLQTLQSCCLKIIFGKKTGQVLMSCTKRVTC